MKSNGKMSNHSNNGRFTKNNTAANKPVKSKTNKATSTYLGLHQGDNVKIPNELKEGESNSRKFIPFGDNNLFPQEMAELSRQGTVTRRIMKSKSRWVMGKGFTSESDEFIEWTKKVNKNESLRQLGIKVKYDKYLDGNGWIEVVKVDDTLQLHHHDTTTVRISRDKTKALIHPDWKNFESRKSLTVEMTLFPEFKKETNGVERSMFQYKEYEPTFNVYGIPTNITGIDSTTISWKTNKYNLSRLDNNFNVSGVLTTYANFSDDDAKDFEEDVKKKFTGFDEEKQIGKQGQILTIVNDPGSSTEGEQTKFEPITTTEDGNWMKLKTDSMEEQIIANEWYPSLSGLNVSNGLSNDVIESEYNVAQADVIHPEQEQFLEIIRQIVTETGQFTDVDDIAFIQIPAPIVASELTGAQVDSMLDVLKAVQAQEISEESGVQTLIVGYDLTTEEANKFFE